MATTVGQHQVSTITDPADGSSMVAATMRTATNAVRTGANDHDNDSGLHLQSSVAGSRPAAGTAGRKWIDTDTLFLKYDNGVSWDDLNYLKLSGGTLTAGLTVSAGGVTVTGNSTITGTLGGVTTLTATTIAGTLSTAAQPNITSFGSLTGLTLSGDLTLSGAANPKVIGGSASTSFRNTGDTLTWLTYSEASNRAEIGTGLNTDTYIGSVTTTNATTGFLILNVNAAGPPTGAATNGALYIDTTNNRLYVRLGGTWKYASLT